MPQAEEARQRAVAAKRVRLERQAREHEARRMREAEAEQRLVVRERLRAEREGESARRRAMLQEEEHQRWVRAESERRRVITEQRAAAERDRREESFSLAPPLPFTFTCPPPFA